VPGVTDWVPFDLKQVYEGTLTVASMLATTRTAYTPTNSAYDAGDTAVFGSGNPIGAIPRSGVTNSADLFGKIIQPLSIGVHGKDVDINNSSTSPNVVTLGTTQSTRSALVTFLLGHFGNMSANVV